ncbi:ABC transporter ATP-binding protein [Streptococcus himalayensis]|uniref:Peptide ABC transporter ATP-binding protein n=1 Tax=Streptococcus himalayensis TaxID=1888195 RepID=A0A917A8D4_9STRE|nr:dipeptide/oligopeptide/nickel ABC transporter ATP-binding protein [Streptococcus himalayensis]GGE34728.1 peptide ABC transporter ATP-binding protein [Streptococcus himalayensis]
MSSVLSCQGLAHAYSRSVGVSGVSFELEKQTALGIVGESGSGKSTIAHTICRFLDLESGEVLLDGKNIEEYSLKDYYKRIQYIPQHPQLFFHPKRTIYQSLEEVLLNFGLAEKSSCDSLIRESLESVGLTRAHGDLFPLQLSGGECQRASIARALLVEPEILVCDEITSALDVTVQAEVMELLEKIKQERETTFLFISHDIALVHAFCEYSLVLKDGRVIEQGETSHLVEHPQADYTALLVNQYKSFEYNQ